MSVDENAAGKKSILRLESFSFNSWRIETAKGHILNKDQEQE